MYLRLRSLHVAKMWVKPNPLLSIAQHSTAFDNELMSTYLKYIEISLHKHDYNTIVHNHFRASLWVMFFEQVEYNKTL